jgi:hypothetical protein
VRSAAGGFQRAAGANGKGEASAVSRLRYQPMVLFMRWNFRKNPIFTSIVDRIGGYQLLQPLRLMERSSCPRLSTSRNCGAAAPAHVIERQIPPHRFYQYPSPKSAAVAPYAPPTCAARKSCTIHQDRRRSVPRSPKGLLAGYAV